MRTALIVATALVTHQAFACSCPNSAAWMWESSGVAHVVRIENVEAGGFNYHGRGNCPAEPTDCYPAQVARYVELERIGNGPPLPPTLASGYGGGDCGLPLLAGSVFVVFKSSPDGEVGICGAFGPYRAADVQPRSESELASFIESLRQAYARPGQKILRAPQAMALDSSPILPPPEPRTLPLQCPESGTES